MRRYFGARERQAHYASVLTRQRDFVARLRRVGPSAGRANPVETVLRRTLWSLRWNAPSVRVSLQALLRKPGAAHRSQAPSSTRDRRVMLVRHLFERALSHSRERVALARFVVPARRQGAGTGHGQSSARPAQAVVAIRRAEASALFPRVAATLARTRAAQPVPPQSAAAPASAPPSRALHAMHGFSTPQTLAPLPAAELSRVTEHVIRQLDKRVVSYRERTGQV